MPMPKNEADTREDAWEMAEDDILGEGWERTDNEGGDDEIVDVEEA